MDAVVGYLQANWIAIATVVVPTGIALWTANHRREERWQSWRRDVVQWAREATLALSTAQMESERLQNLDATSALELRAKLKSQLSAAVDYGRMFFRNTDGLRPEVLDPLVSVVALLDSRIATNEPHRLRELISVHRTNFWRRAQKATNLVRKSVPGITSPAGQGSADYDRPTLDQT